jgi:protein SCO1/2
MRGICERLTIISGIVGAAMIAPAAVARITPADYRDVGVTVPHNASIPPAIVVTDAAGHRHKLNDLISRPTVLVFADYTCRTLCGPILDFVSAALEKSGLADGQYQLIAVGIDPKDGAKVAEEMRRVHIPAGSRLDREALFVTADDPNVRPLTAALGYRYFYSGEDDVYVHPGAAYVLDVHGRVARVLTGLGLSGADMRLALVEASQGKIGTFTDHVRLLCSGFDPVHGVYSIKIWRVLQLASLATILTLGGAIVLLVLSGRRRTA